MFNRVSYESWHDIVPYIAFGVTVLVYLTMSFRGLRLRKEKATEMSRLPLDH